MKDSEFIELLNLYLDHEISAVDAKRLEVEVQSSPSRYRVYREYCQMQKACVIWAEKAAVDLPVDAKIITFPSPKTSWGFGAYAAGICAVAACVALVFVVQGGRGPASTALKPSASTLIASVEILAPMGSDDEARSLVPSLLSLSPRAPEFQPVIVIRNLALTRQQREVGALETTDARFEWMNRVQPVALNRAAAADLVFETQTARQPDQHSFRGRRLIDAQVEQAAFQFQR
ncbi:MAG: hypothetical protein CK538_08820 [Opitutia bacterium]|nr:MAG: hypothetical protein CK538_08820 [Opitutae bacterium]